MYDQMYAYFDPILSISQCGFRQGCSTQTCALVMIKKKGKSIDNDCVSGAVMTDLSEAFDSINYTR